MPLAQPLDGGRLRVYFSARDERNRSLVGSLVMDLERGGAVVDRSISPRPLLEPGAAGFFDDSGTMATALLSRPGALWMYYIGWNLGVSVPFRNAIGLATSRDGGQSFQRHSSGPILDRSPFDPSFVASCHVLPIGDGFRMWYLSCVGWEPRPEGWRHRYHIKTAESRDGANWIRSGHTAIDFRDADEYAISTPRVLLRGSAYHMWYSHRGSRYRIGYAQSADGVDWKRLDADAGIAPGEGGWDSDMIEYPYVFEQLGEVWMLYNGNGYGQSGFGLARLAAW